jgi:hypothetical protein
MVDVMPFLRHVPAWFPGAGFQKKALSWRKTLMEMADIPHDFVKSQMVCFQLLDCRICLLIFVLEQACGTALPSFTSAHLEKELSAREEDNVKWAAASLYSGGSDTVRFSGAFQSRSDLMSVNRLSR